LREFFEKTAARIGVAGLLLSYLWRRKLWWLIPMVSVLLVFGLLIVFAQATAVGPFIYTLF
jgi:hypothetical protein